MRSVRAIALGIVALASWHCGGNVSLGDRPCPCADGYVCCVDNACVAPGKACPADAAGGRGLVVTPATIAALCNAPHGPALPAPGTGAAMKRVVARRWFVCGHDPTSWSPLLVNPGIELRPDGGWAFIRLGPDGTYTVQAADEGKYTVYNDVLAAEVSLADTTPGATLRLRWYNDKLDDFHHGVLDLKTDFERAPLRFRTEKAIPHWFVALDETGDGIEGLEGMACSGDGSWCRPPARCVYERNLTTCHAPATAARGEGCDTVGTRTCAAGLRCLETRRCGP
ncbi:MAG: hypothetical protein JST00_02080 [Deltaproteobacteria bacterium]|nr:hypothetical protein [Deltaproteobacteria bacterium]